MSPAIRTRWLSPTETRGTRVSAWSVEPSLFRGPFLAWDYALDTLENHRMALCAMLAKHEQLGVPSEWHPGSTENGYIWVRVKR